MKTIKSGILILFFGVLSAFLFFSYGYIDPNLTLSSNPLFHRLQAPLVNLVYRQRPLATILFLALLLVLFVCYGIFLRYREQIFPTWKKALIIVGCAGVLLACSYPALTYDLFNYITTAKVIYQHHENPYIVMPIEIPNEPYVAFTRAANKVALYGPVWLLLTAIPYSLGNSRIWQTIITFKLMNAVAYVGFSYLIYRITKNLTNVVFFALNPLILLEVLMNGHNDIYMMIFALGGLFLWTQKRFMQKMGGFILLAASWFVKGATLALAPILFFRNVSFERMLVYAYIFMAAVFFILAPIREELYPWYAVWLIMIASLLPLKAHRYLIGFTIVLSFALELRSLPYMWMGYYEGPGPMLRLLLTAVPLVLYAGYVSVVYVKKKSI